ncbi:uncharacterized protein FIBRA_06566 [Fibroporia radiculosa]|uniref:Uncharacterized protein n=1 Tax=Fibroporia radiculosa TaxID=599839 RepID=J4GSZ8_9APHY|nr:uncharacterized protein FIBRA_06566 [Fibroporia radiculosa]CCM04390.1 predicted protein [Fibroporia radiculosa]
MDGNGKLKEEEEEEEKEKEKEKEREARRLGQTDLEAPMLQMCSALFSSRQVCSEISFRVGIFSQVHFLRSGLARNLAFCLRWAASHSSSSPKETRDVGNAHDACDSATAQHEANNTRSCHMFHGPWGHQLMSTRDDDFFPPSDSGPEAVRAGRDGMDKERYGISTVHVRKWLSPDAPPPPCGVV